MKQQHHLLLRLNGPVVLYRIVYVKDFKINPLYVVVIVKATNKHLGCFND